MDKWFEPVKNDPFLGGDMGFFVNMASGAIIRPCAEKEHCNYEFYPHVTLEIHGSVHVLWQGTEGYRRESLSDNASVEGARLDALHQARAKAIEIIQKIGGMVYFSTGLDGLEVSNG